jgi:hypothetical protein
MSENATWAREQAEREKGNPRRYLREYAEAIENGIETIRTGIGTEERRRKRK